MASWKVTPCSCCLGLGSKHPHLLVSGGVDGDGKALTDTWLFDISRRRWKEVSQVALAH